MIVYNDTVYALVNLFVFGESFSILQIYMLPRSFCLFQLQLFRSCLPCVLMFNIRNLFTRLKTYFVTRCLLM